MVLGEQHIRKVPWTLIYGIGLGLLMAAIVVGMTVKAVQKRGVTVFVDIAPIMAQAKGDMRDLIRRELPGTLSGLRQDAPKRIAEEAGRRLASTTVNVGGFTVPVPEAAVRQVQTSMEQAVRAGLNVAVTDADLKALADRLGDGALAPLEQRVRDMLAQQTFAAEVLPGVIVPVRVVGR